MARWEHDTKRENFSLMDFFFVSFVFCSCRKFSHLCSLLFSFVDVVSLSSIRQRSWVPLKRRTFAVMEELTRRTPPSPTFETTCDQTMPQQTSVSKGSSLTNIVRPDLDRLDQMIDKLQRCTSVMNTTNVVGFVLPLFLGLVRFLCTR